MGTRADIAGKVEIAKVFGGYFSNPANAQAFIDLGIRPILNDLPKNIKYSDFGGGDGYLGSYVNSYLKKKSKQVDTTIVDANPEFLKKVKKLGLKTKLANLEDVKLPKLDLITMRAVFHYNLFKVQKKILKKVYENLTKGGYFINQISTGNEANCKLRNLIKNKELALSGEQGRYEWISVKKYLGALKNTKFSEIRLLGYAPSGSWTLEEQWERVNSTKRANALAKGNLKEVVKIDETKEKFLAYTNKLINMKEYKTAGVEKDKSGSYRVHYQYAIILARK